ncbi:hypothetical protein F5B21DRAFT_504410 [Xylaria acuta]|nr:hypothetical protein F5B21DRAFT_504410 [Xylaria acuta]
MDGLSVAASVVGILSLGIKVAQSLADFYSVYKRQNSDVTHTVKKLERLASVLEILRDQLADRAFLTDEQGLLKNIEGSIQDCEECIHELQNECVKLKNNCAGGIQATARTSARRLAYPFRQSTLQTLDESVEEVASHIALALQILQQKDVYKVQNDSADIKALLELVKASQVSMVIRDWLRAPDVTTNYYEACKKRHGGTGLWFVNGSSFSAWLAKPNSFLWLNGFAGCGKSVLCSTAIQHTFRHRRSNARVGIAFFFFTFNDSAKQDVSGMLRALLLQLSGQLNDNRGLLSLHHNYRNDMPPDRALLGCLRQLLRSFDDAYIILDALDESPRDRYRKAILQTLVDLRVWSEPGLHLLVTSREEPDIRDVLLEELGALPDEIISMRNDAVDNDIKSFVSGSLKSERRLRKWGKYHDQIETALTERANGVFRWVECQLTALDSCAKSKRQLDTLLASLPRSLDKTYERMLLNISGESVEDAKRILTLVCCAKSPLTIPEIIDGIAVELGDRPRLNVDGRLEDEDDIHRICPGLIEICNQPGNVSVVRIAHFSVQEYLESDRIRQHTVATFAVNRPEAHAEIACLCLTYLLEPGLTISTSEYPLALYAAKRWYDHYRDGDQNLHHVRDQASRLFRGTSGEFENWVQIWDVDRRDGQKAPGQVPSPIYYSSLLGLDSVVSELLTQVPPTGLFHEQISKLVNAQGGTCGYALQAASLGGHEKIVQLLLEKGAEVNAQGGCYDSALQAASLGGHEKTVQLLLEEGANVNTEGVHFENALQSAGDREEIIQLFADKSANIHAQGGCQSDYALQVASAGGHEKIVLLLLERGADINATSEGYGTALQAASARGKNNIVQLLLQKGADIDAEGGHRFGNALQAAAMGNYEKTVQLLLYNGANVNMESDSHFGSALRAASARGHEKIVQHLIEKGADVNAQGGCDLGSALHAALANGHEKAIKLLLEKEADTNTVHLSGASALSIAAGHGNISIVKLLLEDNCAQPSLVDNFHRPVALYAAQTGQHTMLKFLIVERKMDPNCQDYYGSTSLSVAIRNGHRESAELLLSIPNIDANMEDNFGRTPVWWAASMGNLDLVKLLTKVGGVGSPFIGDHTSAMNGESETTEESFAWCDVCMVKLRKAHVYYECAVCLGGCFLYIVSHPALIPFSAILLYLEGDYQVCDFSACSDLDSDICTAIFRGGQAPYHNSNPYGQAAWSSLWQNVKLENYTTTGLYSTTVNPTPIPSSELVLPPRDYFGSTDCYRFPNDFILGVAGSAAQVEGAAAFEGRGPNVMEKLVGPAQPKNYVTAENYFLYKHDIQRLAAMGVKYYNFSIPWARILPFTLPRTPVNQEGIDHYDDLINTVLDAGMQPIVTLFHFDSPWVFVSNDNFTAKPDFGAKNGGYQNETFVDAFVNYAKIVLTHYADRVPIWVTFNEPFLYSFNFAGANNVVHAHAQVYDFYHDVLKATGKMDIKFNDNFGVPRNPRNSSDIEAANRFQELHLGFFANPIFLGQQYPDSVLKTLPSAKPLSKKELNYEGNTSDILELIPTPQQ